MVQSDRFEHTDRRVALVSGGASGIGRAIVERLAADGLTLLIADRDYPGAQALAALLADATHPAYALQLDVAEAASIAQADAWIREHLGRLDVLVNNAGIASTHPFASFPVEPWMSTLAVNLTGPMLLGQRAAALMMAQRFGRIINIASVSGLLASGGRTAYGTSKAAILGLTRQMAIELAPHGITVNAIAPGPIDTPMVKALHTSSARDAFTARVPMGRYGTPAEVAAVVSFLASDDASYVTGQTLAVDGGFSIAGVLEY